MENTTLEQVQEEQKKRSKKDFFWNLLFFAIGVGAAFAIIQGMMILQLRTISNEDSYVTASNSYFANYTMFILLLFVIIPFVRDFIFINRRMLTVRQFLKRVLPIAIVCIPLGYLSFFSYLDIGKHSITYDPFWPDEKKVFAWEDIEEVVIDEASHRNRRFDYFVYFYDGTVIDIWGNTTMKLEELKLVDDMIREKGIPKTINEPPYVKGLKDTYGDHPEKYKMVQQIIRE